MEGNGGKVRGPLTPFSSLPLGRGGGATATELSLDCGAVTTVSPGGRWQGQGIQGEGCDLQGKQGSNPDTAWSVPSSDRARSF